MASKKNQKYIPFNKPYLTGKELKYIQETFLNNTLSGDGPFTKNCNEWIENQSGCKKALLTHSCTAGLEMSASLLNIEPGDEIIMPSYTFTSTANAFVLRGGVPVFVDIRKDTLNLDETLIASAVTQRTKAIVPVHYAGVGCEMDSIMDVAQHHGLKIVEDAAQGVMASYKGKALGSIGDLGTYSFHETKNIISGEGGALLINNPKLILRAEIIREKGTNRSRFIRGEVDKYTWQEAGSSYLPSELTAAFLSAQFENSESITNERLEIWNRYHTLLKPLEQNELLQRPIVPPECKHNAHMYYVILSPRIDRRRILETLKKNGINAAFHYSPLHSSPAGKRYGRTCGNLQVTDQHTEGLIRLPLWIGLSIEQQHRIIGTLSKALKNSQI